MLLYKLVCVLILQITTIPIKMDIGYLNMKKSRVIGYPKSDFSGLGSGSDIENFGFSDTNK